MRPFRNRITLIIALSFLLLTTLVMLGFNAFAVHEIAHQQKKTMKAISRSILETLAQQGVTEQIPQEIIAELNKHVAFADRDKDISYAIISHDYRVRYRTPGFSIPLDREFIDTPHSRQFLQSVNSGGTLDDMLAQWQFLFRAEDSNYIVFVSDYGNYELVERVIEGMAIAILITLLLSVPLGVFISSKTLRPLDSIRETVLRICAGDLSARVPPTNLQDELGQLMTTLNETLAELEESFSRIRQFSADAAHELGTPLAALQGTLDACLARERDAEEYRRVLASSFEELAMLSRMIKDLLLLATPGAGRPDQFRQLELGEILRDERERLESLATAADITLDFGEIAGIEIDGEEMLLARMVRNVTHNAIRFAPAGTVVSLQVTADSGRISICVSDSGIGIAPDDHEQIFERFYQVEKSRQSGSGLGLPIARWVARFHGGDIMVASSLGDGATFTIDLPASHEVTPE